jgi:nitrite reductase/ring-hydroxylating ferredoxin subunit
MTPEVKRRVHLCGAGDVRPGGALRVEAGDLALAVFNVDGTFYAIDDHCTHGPGSLSEGYLDGCIIECNFHNGAFDIRTGEVVSPPCMIPVRTYRVIVEGGQIFVETPSRPSALD